MTKQYIGTEAYLQAYQNSSLTERERLEQMLTQLGAVIDEYGMLQLYGPYQLAPDLAPHSAFYARIRLSVQRAFSTKEGLNEDELGLKMHLFRNYIDKQNIEYVRSHFEGATDFDKLEAYRRKFAFELDYTTGANYHNRTQGPFDYPRNMKILVPKKNTLNGQLNNARMGEFIVSLQTGMFVSQWNVYQRQDDGTYDCNPDHYDLQQCGDVANTESANYGASHGKNKDLAPNDRTHARLDVDHPPDLLMRRQATRIWRSEQSFNQGGRYADIVKKSRIDYDCWQQVPLVEKADVYEQFLQHCIKTKRNRGFADFYQPKKMGKRSMGLSIISLVVLAALVYYVYQQH